jgi:hypothetical protein
MKDLIYGVDYVICPICGKRVKEINTSHLKLHDLTVKMFDDLYPNFERLSKVSRDQKATFTGKKHTNEHKQYMSKIISRYRKGITLTDKHKKSISESCKKTWRDNHDWLVYTKSYEHFINLHGEDIGKKMWIKRYNNISKANTNINNHKLYHEYLIKVRRITNISIKQYGLDDINKRSRKFHLDHKVSICYGYNNDISPFVIGSIYNLKIIPASVNTSKQENCSMCVDKLIEMVDNDIFYKKLKDELYL